MVKAGMVAVMVVVVAVVVVVVLVHGDHGRGCIILMTIASTHLLTVASHDSHHTTPHHTTPHHTSPHHHHRLAFPQCASIKVYSRCHNA
jgi:hypothetical protein